MSSSKGDLSRRIGRIVGAHVVSLEERERIIDAADNAETWNDLTADVRLLLAEIQTRPGPGVV